MPRKNPIPAEDKKVTDRMLAIRRQLNLSRAAFAEIIGLRECVLANIELGRSRWKGRDIQALEALPQWSSEQHDADWKLRALTAEAHLRRIRAFMKRVLAKEQP